MPAKRVQETALVFDRLCAHIDSLAGTPGPDDGPPAAWEAENWALAHLWVDETLAQARVILGSAAQAGRALEVVSEGYRKAAEEGLVCAAFRVSLARSRFLATSCGAFDMSEQDILQLGFEAHQLAEEGYNLRTSREMEAIMRWHFGDTLHLESSRRSLQPDRN